MKKKRIEFPLEVFRDDEGNVQSTEEITLLTNDYSVQMKNGKMLDEFASNIEESMSQTADELVAQKEDIQKLNYIVKNKKEGYVKKGLVSYIDFNMFGQMIKSLNIKNTHEVIDLARDKVALGEVYNSSYFGKNGLRFTNSAKVIIDLSNEELSDSEMTLEFVYRNNLQNIEETAGYIMYGYPFNTYLLHSKSRGIYFNGPWTFTAKQLENDYAKTHIHISVDRANERIRTYHNGLLVKEYNGVVREFGGDEINLGHFPSGGTANFNMDMIRVYNRALSTDEVKQNYMSEFGNTMFSELLELREMIAMRGLTR